MTAKKIPITCPTLSHKPDIQRIFKEILNSGMITNGKYVEKFENRIRKYLRVKHAIAVNSCTSGLMLILKALNLEGEIIMPSFTFHATGHAAVWNNLKPVFVDCRPDTYNIDPEKVEKAITPLTSAILAVYIFGNPPEITSLEKIAAKHHLKLVFDAAHGFGSLYQGKPPGGFGNAESFSLSPTKLITSAEGGIVTTNDDKLAQKVRFGRTYGDGGDYNPQFSGLSARMSELHAALGLMNLKSLEQNVSRRIKLVNLYKKLLIGIPGISFQTISDGNRSSYKDLSIYIDTETFGISRDRLYDALLAKNIIAKKYFSPPLHRQIAFKKYTGNKEDYINTNLLSENSISLPLYSHLQEKTVRLISKTIDHIRQRCLK